MEPDHASALNFRPEVRNAKSRHFVRFDQRDDRSGFPLHDRIEVLGDVTRPRSTDGKRSCLPGAKVMPIRPRTAPGSTVSILNGCVSLVLIIQRAALAGFAAVAYRSGVVKDSGRPFLLPAAKLLLFNANLSPLAD
jgi:hypothetical protein